MYHVNISINGETVQDYSTSKREIVRTIARETGLSQQELSREIEARNNSQIFRDSLGFRVWVSYE